MALDPTTIVSTIVGSFIAMATSLLVAVLYIRSQKLNEEKKRINEQLQKTYIEQGILPMQEALSQYGVGAIYGINDLRVSAVRSLKMRGSEELLKETIDEIKMRPVISDLIQRKFCYAIESLPYIRRFGMPVYGSIVRTLQNYSEILSDILTFEVAKNNIDKAGIDEFSRSASVVAQILQGTQIYLLTRLDNLKDKIWKCDFKSYTDFLDLLQSEEYKKFVLDFEQYNKLLTSFVDAVRSPDSDARKTASLALSKWLNENTEKNPFD